MVDFQECLICSATLHKDTEGKSSSSLKNQIRSVFILRKILEISTSTCSNLLLRTQNNPSTWFSCCWECYAIAIEAERIFSELAKLQTKWKRLKTSLESKVLDCTSQKTPRSQSKRRRKCEILEIIRQETAKRLELISDRAEDARRRCQKISLEELTSIDSDAVKCDPIKTEQEDIDELEDIESMNAFPPPDFNFEKASTFSHENNEIFDKAMDEDRRSVEASSGAQGPLDAGSDFWPSENSDSDADFKGKKVKARPSSRIRRGRRKKVQVGDYPCEYCHTLWTTVLKKKIHQVRCHDIKYDFKCPFCAKNFYSGYTLLRHTTAVHPEKTFTDVPEDDKIVSVAGIKLEDDRPSDTQIEMDKEDDTRSSDKPVSVTLRKFKRVRGTIKCEHCPRLFVSTEKMNQHFKRTHAAYAKLADTTQYFPCSLCEERFPTQRKLLYHREKVHNVGSRERSATWESHSLVNCGQCDKKFQKRYLATHISIVHRKERNFICENCPQSFTSTTYLRYHQIKEHGQHSEGPNSKLQCKECGKMYSNTAYLTKHVTTVHRREYKFKCPICGAGCGSQSHLDKHIMGSHTDNRPFACSECPKAYLDESKLKRHMRTHTGETPFSCSVCAKGFADRQKLKRHETNLHASENLFECDKCEKRFPSKAYLRMHKYHAHKTRKITLQPKKLVVGKDELEKILNSTAPPPPSSNVNNEHNYKLTKTFSRIELEKHCKSFDTKEAGNTETNRHNSIEQDWPENDDARRIS